MMFFSLATGLLSLSSSALGGSLVPRQNLCAGDSSIAGYCTPDTWVGLTNSSSPLITECMYACRGINSDAGDWGADLTGKPEGQKTVVIGYPCTFSLGRGPGQGDPLTFSMHNQDILDIYNGAIGRFGSNGRVSAQGTMICEGKTVAWWVD